jgi:Fe-S-cluster containining protein
MRYIPWSRIRSWRCTGCGRCCSRFRVVLRAYEYALITENFGQMATWIDGLGDPCLAKVGGRCVFQDWSGLCRLQSMGMKPLACKVWPFIVQREPRPRSTRDASFHYRGEEYFVYVDTTCPCDGMNRGDPDELPLTVAEAIEISRDPDRPQRYTTAIRKGKIAAPNIPVQSTR